MSSIYQIASMPPGRTDKAIIEVDADKEGCHEGAREFLSLPADTPLPVLFDITQALTRAAEAAYDRGRADRTAELLPLRDENDWQRNELHDHLLDAAAEWGPGQTEKTDQDGDPQHILLIAQEEAAGTADFRIGKFRYGDGRVFRAHIMLIEIEQEAGS